MNLPRLPGANARPLFCAYANFFAKPACYITHTVEGKR